MRALTFKQLSPAARELIAAARQIIGRLHFPEKHHVGAALRTRSGRVFLGVHLETYVGRIAVCAEAIALGAAATAGDHEVDLIVAARYTGEVVSPCGMCREMISDFSPRARVIVPRGRGYLILPIRRLLPFKYRKKDSVGGRTAAPAARRAPRAGARRRRD